MDKLTTSEHDDLAKMLGARKQVMNDEIHTGLAGLRGETIEDILADTTDAGDVASANQMTEVSNAEVARDTAELRDIVAAEARLTDGTYGICVDCDAPIPYARLAAYPTAKRCIRCQEIREEKS